MFSPQERQQILERLLAELQSNDRIAGVVVVGSAATGFEDDYSDIDLTVPVAEGAPLQSLFREWEGRIRALFPVAAHFTAEISDPEVYLHGFLLDNYLELDISFMRLADLFAKRERWRVAFDRIGRIEDIMRTTWENRADLDVQARYQRILSSIWHYITHVANLFPMALSVATGVAAGQADRASARLSLGGGLAILIAPLTLGWTADQLGLQEAFIIVVVLFIIAAAVTTLANRITPSQLPAS